MRFIISQDNHPIVDTIIIMINCRVQVILGAQWPGGRKSDSESRGPGFNLHTWHRVVSLTKTH